MTNLAKYAVEGISANSFKSLFEFSNLKQSHLQGISYINASPDRIQISRRTRCSVITGSINAIHFQHSQLIYSELGLRSVKLIRN
jgi:hypothetical protein